MERQPSEQEFTAAMQRHLDDIHPALVLKLREIISSPLPAEADALYFFYFSDSFESAALPVTANAMAFTEDGPDWVDWPEVEGRLLLDTPTPQLFNGHSTNGFDSYGIAIKLSGSALLKAWATAGGAGYNKPAFFAEHDDVERLNLVTAEWEPSA